MADEYNVLRLMSGNEPPNDTAKATNEFQAAWEDAQSESLHHLRNIDKNVEELLKKGIPMSQSAARDAASRSRARSNDEGTTATSTTNTRSKRDIVFGRPDGMKKGQRFRHDGRDADPPDYAKGKGNDHKSRWEKEFSFFNDMLDRTAVQFFDDLEDGLLEQVGFFDLTKELKGSLQSMADTLGVSIEDVGPELGRMAAQNISSKFAETDFGKNIKSTLSGVFGKVQGAVAGMASDLDRDVIQTPKDAQRVQHNKANRQADEQEAAFDASDDRAQKGQFSYDDYLAGGVKTWDKITSSMFNAPQGYSPITEPSAFDIESGSVIPDNSAVLPDDTLILAQSAVNITAQSVTLSVDNPLQQDGYRDRDEVDNSNPFDRSQSWADDEDYPEVDENYQPIDSSSFDASEMANNFSDKVGDAIDLVDNIKGGNKGEAISKGFEMISKGQGGASGMLGQGGTKIAGLLGSGSGAGASSTALATTSSTALATTGSAAGAGAAGAAGAGAAGAGAAGAAGAGTAMTAAGGGAMAAGGSGALAAAGPYGWIAIVVIALAKKLIEVALTSITAAFNDVKEKWGELKEDIGDAFNRSAKSAEKNQELAQKRYDADVKSLIEEPFTILKDAAQKMYDVWDANLRQINATQGYDKAGLQDLISDYAERLRDEGLAAVVGASDITQNLSKVLDSGMSGAIAEEFAYIATKLNAAIPTQDFFSYGETYVSLASQAMQAGMSQAEAIAYANDQLESFASGVLYANRTLTGGFTTGLQDASNLFKQAAQIAQSARSQNVSQIASVLTAVSGIVGGIAPDLADGLIDAVYNAAVGGNASSIVALRSMAGINASNTEFLRELAANPQKIFADMFSGFAELQNMSKDNYMEVAEALAETFGVSMDAIARVDFNYLARAIENMDAGSSALSENVAHLASGQTTTSEEALRLAQVNQYMIEEGLSYVLDNQVARSIQEHMWDEQIARELMEAAYAVELQGSALAFLQSIMNAVDTILTVLNPFRLVSKLGDLVATAIEGRALQSDIKQTLLLGKVGKGNASSFYDMTTRNEDLNLTPSYVYLQGGVSSFGVMEGLRDVRDILNPLGSYGSGLGALSTIGSQVTQGLLSLGDAAANSLFSSRDSAYSWGSVGKADAAAIANTDFASGATSAAGNISSVASSKSAQEESNAKLEALAAGKYIQENFVAQGKTYEDWVKHVKSEGFADVEAAIVAAGWKDEDIKGQFLAAEGQLGSDIRAEMENREQQMQEIITLNIPIIVECLLKQQEFQDWQKNEAWEQAVTWGQNIQAILGDPNETSIQDLLGTVDNNNSIIGLLYSINDSVSNADGTGILNTLLAHKSLLDTFKSEMVNYIVKHDVYNSSLNGATTNTSTDWYSKIKAVQSAEKDEASSAIYALAEALTANVVDLKDPQVAGNALLAQILKVLQVIQTQQAGQIGGGSGSLADSLIGLALGYTANNA